MASPSIPIEVDQNTGVWSTDGLPMIYMPRHFFLNTHFAVEDALTVELYAEKLYAAGHKSAWDWCKDQTRTHCLSGFEVFHHYVSRISQRGWGQFTVTALDEKNATADICLQHSVFVEHCGADAGRNLCYMYAGWFAGALEWASQETGQFCSLTSYEALCAANGARQCLFKVRPS